MWSRTHSVPVGLNTPFNPNSTGPGFFVSEDTILNYRTTIECATHNQATARSDMHRVANAVAAQFPYGMHLRIGQNEIKLFSQSSFHNQSYTGKVYINTPVQLT
jgi:hypothetical protein